MSEEMVGTGESPAPQGQEATPASSPDPSDFEARLRSDPEFAVAEFKKQQAAASRAADRLRKGERALQIAEAMGNGDVAVGAEAALKELMLFRKMRDHPQLGHMVERFQKGEPIEPQASTGGSALYGGLPDEEDPRDQQLRTLQGELSAIKGQLGVNRFVDLYKGFAESDIGSLLDANEKGEVFSSLKRQIETWAETPLGRERLSKLTPDDIETVALKELRRSGKLLDLGRRSHQQRTEQLRSRETDVPDRISTSVPKKAPVEISAVDALRQAADELGITLRH